MSVSQPQRPEGNFEFTCLKNLKNMSNRVRSESTGTAGSNLLGLGLTGLLRSVNFVRINNPMAGFECSRNIDRSF